MEVLAGDVGGTKTLVAIAGVGALRGPAGGPSIDLREGRRYDSRQYPGLGAMGRAFAQDLGRPLPRHAAFGVAGPVSGGRAHTTNLPWILDEAELAGGWGVESVRLSEDLPPPALGVPPGEETPHGALHPGARGPARPPAPLRARAGG